MANSGVRAAFFASNARRQEKILRMIKAARRLRSIELPQDSDAEANLNKSRGQRLLFLGDESFDWFECESV
jgi:hypothetical protein